MAPGQTPSTQLPPQLPLWPPHCCQAPIAEAASQPSMRQQLLAGRVQSTDSRGGSREQSRGLEVVGYKRRINTTLRSD